MINYNIYTRYNDIKNNIYTVKKIYVNGVVYNNMTNFNVKNNNIQSLNSLKIEKHC